MKINSVSKINKNEYPSENEITDKKIKHSIPTRWRKLGISAFVFEIIMQANANKTTYAYTARLSGEEQVYDPNATSSYEPDEYKGAKIITGGINLISVAVLITSIVMLITRNIKAKKAKTKAKGNVVFMVLSIVSGVALITTGLVYAYIKLSLE